MIRFFQYFIAAMLLAFSTDIHATGPAPTTPPAPSGNEYTLTVIPFYSPEKIWTLYAPFIDHLKDTTAKPWQLKLYPTHDALLDDLCAGLVSLALLGPVPLGRAMEKCGAEPIVVALGKNGKPDYHSIVVTSDHSIASLEELKGKRFGLFKGSTAAHILPRKLLQEAGLQKNDITPVFYESQDYLMNALLAHDIAAAGFKDSLYWKFEGESLRVLKSSDELPNFAFAAAPGLSAETRKLMVDALIALKPTTSDKDKKLMETWDDEVKNGFIEPPADFRSSVLNLLALTNEILREDR